MKRREIVIAIALFVMTLAVFYPSIHYDYVKLDDDQYVASNPRVATGLTWDNIRWAFVTPHEDWWLPLLWISYMTDAEFFGHRPFGYHLTNILLHAVNVALLFWFLFRLTGSRWRSAFVAALFALHPTRVEAVVWITSRKDTLSGLFFMLSLLAYLRYVEHRDTRRYAAVFGLMFVGLMSKAILIILPVILLLLDYWPLGRVRDSLEGRASARPGSSRRVGVDQLEGRASARPGSRGSVTLQEWKPLILEKIPLFILAVGFALIGLRTHIVGTAVGTGVSVLKRFGLMFPNFWAYLRLVFWPADLALIYPEHDVIHWPVSVAALVSLLAVTGACFHLRKRAPYLIVGWLWFLAGLIPIIRGVRFGLAAYADRYTYLPLIGLGIMAAWGGGEAARRSARAAPLLATVAVAILIACTWHTSAHMPLWKDSLTMFSRLIEQAPDHYTANNNYAKALVDAGRLAEALPYFRRAAEQRPWSTLAVANLGEALVDLDRNDEAVEWMEQALRDRDPHSVNAHFVLGRAYLNLNRAADAILHLDFAYRAHPDRVAWLVELIRALYEAGQPAEAEQAIRVLHARGVRYIQNYESLFPYYAHLWRQGEAAHAWYFFKHALERHPDEPGILGRAAWLIATDPNPPAPYDEALKLARRAVTHAPASDPAFLDALAAAQAANEQFDEAIATAERALRLARQSGQTDLALRLTQRLATYRAGRPWRE